MYGIAVTLLTVAALSLAAFSHWNLSHGRLRQSYKLNIVVYSLFMVLDNLLAFQNPAQLALLLFNVTNIWAIAMAIKGLRRDNARAKS